MAAVELAPGELAGVRPSGGHGALWWVARRLAFCVVVIFLVTVIVFAATQALPADPAKAILGRQAANPAVLAAMREQLGLNQSLLGQYTGWLGRLLHGDLGVSLAAHVPVSELIGYRLVNSLALIALAALISVPASILLGAITAVRRDRMFDRLSLAAGMVLTSAPDFVVGMLLAMLLGTTVFTVLPAVALIPQGDSPFAHLDALALPVLALVLGVVAYLYRLVRAAMIDVLESDYVQMARLKGLPTRLVLRRHALPNAMVPAIQASALVFGYLVSGTIVIEVVFRFPGLGTALSDAINNRDLPTAQAISIVYALAIVLSNLAADMLTVLATPRLRAAGR